MEEIKTRKPIKLLTLEERQTIERECKKGTSVRQIAFILGKEASCISKEIRRNGGKENYSSKNAHETAIIRMQNRCMGISAALNISIPKLVERIEVLESQLEIILDVIQGTKNDTANE